MAEVSTGARPKERLFPGICFDAIYTALSAMNSSAALLTLLHLADEIIDDIKVSVEVKTA